MNLIEIFLVWCVFAAFSLWYIYADIDIEKDETTNVSKVIIFGAAIVPPFLVVAAILSIAFLILGTIERFVRLIFKFSSRENY